MSTSVKVELFSSSFHPIPHCAKHTSALRNCQIQCFFSRSPSLSHTLEPMNMLLVLPLTTALTYFNI